MDIGYCWDTGLLRQINEDSVCTVSFDLKTHLGTVSAGLFAVADGMGGHNAGEIASDLAIRMLQATCISGLLSKSPEPPLKILEVAFKKANLAILEAAAEKSLEGMGTTLTAAVVIGQDLFIAHIGDSRCYVINSRETLQITKDHSVVQQLVDAGIITAVQARSHPRKNEITRVLGFSGDSEPDLLKVKLYAGDNLLLCSDGLCAVMPDDIIAEAVLHAQNASQACADLTARVNLEGGPDNISVIVVKPDNLPSWQAMATAQTSVRVK